MNDAISGPGTAAAPGSPHPVQEKLAILSAYQITADGLTKQAFYRAYTSLSWVREAAALVAGIGVAPVIKVLADGDVTSGAVPASWPPAARLAAIAGFLVWGLLKYGSTQWQWERRAASARSCRDQFKSLWFTALQAVADRDPMPALVEVHREMGLIIHQAIKEGAWPSADIPEATLQAGKRRAAEIANANAANWTPAPRKQRAGVRRTT